MNLFIYFIELFLFNSQGTNSILENFSILVLYKSGTFLYPSGSNVKDWIITP